jgi:nicotinic acid mononucleotide adenylyltransferase
MPQTSTQLRAALAEGQGIDHHTPAAVADHIARERLYRSPANA